MSKEDLEFRTYNAINQLLRYGYAPESSELVAVLEKLSDINSLDSVANGYADVDKQIDECKALLDQVAVAEGSGAGWLTENAHPNKPSAIFNSKGLADDRSK